MPRGSAAARRNCAKLRAFAFAKRSATAAALLPAKVARFEERAAAAAGAGADDATGGPVTSNRSVFDVT